MSKTYIDREAALNKLRQIRDDYRSRYNGTEAAAIAEYCRDALIDIPTAADVEKVRHACWVWDENGMDWGLGAWKCSGCHRKPETWWETDKGSPSRCAGSNYCPNCGAKMDGGVNDEID